MGFLQRFRVVNVTRCNESFHGCERWSELEWAGALAGEVGELANLLKKHKRGEVIDWNDVKDEIADVFTYLDLLASVCGVELETAICDKFNRVSDRVGSPRKIVALVQE